MNDDLISRSALRVEMETYVMPILANNLMGATDAYYRTLHLLDEAPAVDAEKVCEQMGLVKEAFEMAKADLVAVCRCKDCVHWREAKTNSKGFLICPASGMEIMATDFCSYGERRADGEDLRAQ